MSQYSAMHYFFMEKEYDVKKNIGPWKNKALFSVMEHADVTSSMI